MLVLSRKRGERIVIGSNIELTVVDVRGGSVRLGFDAPQEVSIHRQEIHRRIQEEGRGSACGSSTSASAKSERNS